MPAIGLSLQSRLTFSPGAVQAVAVVRATFSFGGKACGHPAPALRPAPQESDSSNFCACPALPEPVAWLKAAVQRGAKVMETMGTGWGVALTEGGEAHLCLLVQDAKDSLCFSRPAC